MRASWPSAISSRADPEASSPTRQGGKRSEKLQQLVAPDRLGDHNATGSINAVNLKDVLGQIEPNGGDRR